MKQRPILPILTIFAAATAFIGVFSVPPAQAGPITNGPGNPPFTKLGVYDGVISIIPSATSQLLEIGNNGQDIAGSGDIYFRPGEIPTGNTANSRFYKPAVSGPGELGQALYVDKKIQAGSTFKKSRDDDGTALAAYAVAGAAAMYGEQGATGAWAAYFSGKVTANQYCINEANCISAWPAGGSITVKDGSTTVSPTNTINFTSGATVTNAGGGVANIAVSGGPGGTGPLDTVLGIGNASPKHIVLGQDPAPGGPRTGLMAGAGILDVSTFDGSIDGIHSAHLGNNNTKAAVYGENNFATGWAGYFSGKLNVTTNTFLASGGSLISPTIDLALGDTDTGLNQVSDGNLDISTNGTSVIRLTNGQQVGIGTTSPLVGTKVDIVGGSLRLGNMSGTCNDNNTSKLYLNNNGVVICGTDQNSGGPGGNQNLDQTLGFGNQSNRAIELGNYESSPGVSGATLVSTNGALLEVSSNTVDLSNINYGGYFDISKVDAAAIYATNGNSNGWAGQFNGKVAIGSPYHVNSLDIGGTRGVSITNNNLVSPPVIPNGELYVKNKIMINTSTSNTFELDVNGQTNSTEYCIGGGNCISSWPSGNLNGTPTRIPYFNTATTLADSPLVTNGTIVTTPNNFGIGQAAPNARLVVNSGASFTGVPQGNVNDAMGVYGNTTNSALYVQQDGAGWSGYFSGSVNISASLEVGESISLGGIIKGSWPTQVCDVGSNHCYGKYLYTEGTTTGTMKFWYVNPTTLQPTVSALIYQDAGALACPAGYSGPFPRLTTGSNTSSYWRIECNSGPEYVYDTQIAYGSGLYCRKDAEASLILLQQSYPGAPCVDVYPKNKTYMKMHQIASPTQGLIPVLELR